MKSIAKLMVVAMLLVAALVVAPVAAGRVITQNGTTVYVGEEDLNLTGANFTGAIEFVHYTSEKGTSAIDERLSVNSEGNITEISKGIPTGDYYARGGGQDGLTHYIIVKEPDLTLDVVLNTSHKDSVASKSVARETKLDFELKDNIKSENLTASIDIKVTTPAGGTTTYFGGQPLKGIELVNGRQYIGEVNLTGAEAGTYTVQAKWPEASDFYGKGFDSNPVTFEVSTKKLAITSDKDSVVRGKTFSVTITGESKQDYILFVQKAGTLAESQYPLIAPALDGVTNATKADCDNLNFSGTNVSTAVANILRDSAPGLNYTQAWVKTTAGGTRTVQFNTTSSTDDRQFTIRVQDVTNPATYDEIKVKVEKGAVTITAAGTGTYYIGEEITLEGTCTESDYVYLFITGPNLPSDGAYPLNPSTDAVSGNKNTFIEVEVEADDTWSEKWNTAEIDGTLDAGGYTIYAVSAPVNKKDLTDAEYDTISIQLRSGFISAVTSGAVVAKGDDLKLTGVAQGDPDDVHVWIFGKNYYGTMGGLEVRSENVEDDGTFEFELDGSDTEHLSAGQYFVVIQHPMMNKIFDIQAAGGLIIGTPGSGFTPVAITNLQAAAAANALIKALDSPNIDDTYVKLTFVVEEPRILIDPIGDVPAGSTFTISGTT
ncbi:MAG TPA: MEMAR_RS02690 family S-layer glycoprotein, partial [Bacillota bacterium]|nr:MEMAR_RS02690 family S-layer glycoprotein [Bacillota bacterium]